MDIRTGDIILTSKESVVVWFMNLFQKDPCFWGHVLVAKDDVKAWESYWTLRESDIEKAIKKRKYYKIIRKNDLTEEQKEEMREIAPDLLGYPYGVGRMFLQTLDHIFSTNWFTKLDDREYSQVCSSYGAWIFKKACDYEFNGVPWQSCDPDDIEDDQQLYPEKWSIVSERNIRR